MKTKLDHWEILAIGMVAVVTFGAWTLAHRAIAGRAIKRARRIEDRLREKLPYDGYQVSSFITSMSWENWKEAARHSTFKLPLAVGTVVVLGISLFAFLNRERGVGDALASTAIAGIKEHVSIQTSVEATNTTAQVTAAILPSNCVLKLEKKADSVASWTLSSINCNPDLSRPHPPSTSPASAGGGAGQTSDVRGVSDAAPDRNANSHRDQR